MVLGAQIGAIFIFFSVSFIGVWTPFFIPVKPLFLKSGLLFASGLFLALALLHLAVETFEELEEVWESPYPLAFLFVGIGFFVTWFADLLAEGIWNKSRMKALAGAEAMPPSPNKDVEGAQVAKSVWCCKGGDGQADSKCSDAHCSCTGSDACACKAGPMVNSVVANESMSIGGALSSATDVMILDVILLLLALTFHAFFEGLAVGLQSSLETVWSMVVAISINEFFEGAALGTTLRAQNSLRSPWKYLLYAIAASIVAPIGVAVGIALQETVDDVSKTWVEGVGSGLACGVFICVATKHLIPKGMTPEGPNEALWVPFLKYGFSFLGFTVNALTTLRSEE